ncbi:hypothetical protein Q7P37_007432 [Cladosporium fusiforme]
MGIATSSLSTMATPAQGSVGSLLESGKYSDLTLKCGNRSWKVHKSVVCLRSDFFAGACDGLFKEPCTNVIDMSDDDEHALAAMIRFMYHDTYDTTVLPPDDHAIFLHIRVFALANKYFVAPLQDLAERKTVEELANWDTLVFAQAVKEIYALTAHTTHSSTLRTAAVSIAHENATKLFGSGDKAKYCLMRETLEESPGFMSDLAASMSSCIDHQSGLIVDSAISSSLLQEDAKKLESEKRVIEQKLFETKKDLLQARVDATKLEMKLSEKPKLDLPFAPKGVKSDDDPEMKWYRCPNCNTVFVRGIWPYANYAHPCYSGLWTGVLDKSSLQMKGREWDNFLFK